MKKVEAIIKPFKLDDVKDSAGRKVIPSFTGERNTLLISFRRLSSRS